MPRDPEPTRQRLLDAALRLCAEKGVSATSLREIRLAAGESNNFAAQYHFGDKRGLLRKLLEREIPWLVQRRAELLREADDAWTYAAVWVLPFAELATGTTHQRFLVQLLSQLQNDVSLSLDDVLELTGDTGWQPAAEGLRRAIGETDVELYQQRLVLAIISFLHAAALWAKGQHRLRLLDDDVFRRNLVDMFLGAVTVHVTRLPAVTPAHAGRRSTDDFTVSDLTKCLPSD